MDMGALRRIVAANIVSLRTANHMTQLELGEKLNYSDKAISRWERGEAVPDAGVLLQLSQLFGVTVDYLLHEHAEEKSQKVPPWRINHRTVALISFIGVWTAALFVFIVFYLLGQIQWLSFVYALPVSLTVLLVMNNSGLELMPATVMTLRQQAGSASPGDVWLPTLIATAASAATAALMLWFTDRR